MPDHASVVVRKRILLALLFVMLAMLGLICQLFRIQILGNNWLGSKALDQRYRNLVDDARRGPIYDAQGKRIAISVSAESVQAVPAQIEDPVATAKALAGVLDMDFQSIYEKITKNVWSIDVKRKVDLDTAQKVKALKLPGIWFTEKGARFYANDSMAGQVLGIVGVDNVGLEGLELEYNSVLAGKPGARKAEVDAEGRDIPLGDKAYVPPEDGNGIVLTIDERLQLVSERVIRKAVIEANSKRGCVILMDPTTGGILALAVYPTFDPFDYLDYPDEYRRCWPILDTYEPGSTFKVITAAAVLDSKTRSIDSTFMDPGFVVVGDRRLRCWKAGGHGLQTFTETLENSCNPAFATYATEMGVDTFYRYIRAFGFGESTGVDFPGAGSAKGLLMPTKSVGPVELANMGFGQGIAVTPLQLVRAMAAVANGGTLMKPRLVDAVVDDRMIRIQEFEPESVRQVISPETAKELTTALVSVVENGSGTRAQIPGYLVAGKTGTAQKPKPGGGGYGEGRVASFLGFAPADDPAIVGLVVLDEPNTFTTYGGVLAAPAFQAIISDSLRLLGIAPNQPVDSTSRGAGQARVPDVRNYGVADAETLLKQARLGVKKVGQGAVVIGQSPVPGVLVPENTVVNLTLGDNPEDLDQLYLVGSKDNGSDGLKAQQTVLVPNVIGMTVRGASTRLQDLGLFISVKGSGFAVRSDPPAGKRVAVGSTITVEFGSH